MPDAEAGETLTVSVGGVLDAAVGVEDEAGQRLAAPDGHAEGGESEICVDAVGEGVADDLLCAKAVSYTHLLVEYIDQLENGTAWFTAEDLAQALKIVINSVYGLTAANLSLIHISWRK